MQSKSIHSQPRLRRISPLLALGAITLVCTQAVAQGAPAGGATYRQLRGLLPSGASIPVNDLTLKRDAATFTFTHGEFALYGEVNGKITGAVFAGAGHFHLTPPTAIERHSLVILTKKEEFDEDFNRVVLRFTDGTADELRKAGTATGKADSSMIQSAMEFRTFQREKLGENIDLRLLADVMSPSKAGAGGFFFASIKGSGIPHTIFEIDPHGAPLVSPEEVRLSTWNDWGWTYPAAFHLAAEYAANTASSRELNSPFKVESEELDTSIEKNGFLSGVATVHLFSRANGLVVVPMNLFPTLRVTKAEGEHGEVLDFVQEDKRYDSDFGLVLAHPLNKGETAIVRVTYGGKDAVFNAGSSNYDPIARENWFPNGGVEFGDYTIYKMLFHVPKDIELIATGNKLSDKVDGKIRTSEWDSKIPLPVAGFHLGRFVEKDDKTPSGLAVSAFANTDLPDWASSIPSSGEAVGTMSTASMLPVELSEGRVAAQIYEGYFGKLSFDHMALSQQPACNYGQSWPMLVYLPICGFWDSQVQHTLGISPEDPYWKVVTAHEVAHQWWGSTVGFGSYRDQWMSEGFANASATIFLEATRKTPADYRDFWAQMKRQLTEKNADGFRAIDVGPVTMGFRLSSPKTGWSIYQNLVYPKGAYILHMLQMMMRNNKTGDDNFRAMMHDFVDTYRLKVATTEDFKAIVEKHMTAEMDLDGNHRMDWFFNEYVYGTNIPTYHFESQATPDNDKIGLHFKLTQSDVPASFKMLVPIYLELADGRSMLLGRVSITGDTSLEKSVAMAKPPAAVKRLTIDSMHDLLAIEK